MSVAPRPSIVALALFLVLGSLTPGVDAAPS